MRLVRTAEEEGELIVFDIKAKKEQITTCSNPLHSQRRQLLGKLCTHRSACQSASAQRADHLSCRCTQPEKDLLGKKNFKLTQLL